MGSKYKAAIFDLSGVLLNWSTSTLDAISSSHIQSMMNSTSWFELERGNLTLEEACEVNRP
jgi:hypothetical protein